MKQFIWGALTMASAIATLLFLRYWKVTRDRLFAFFAAAFAIMGFNWIGLAIIDPGTEHRYIAYLPRLAAFVLIILGIVDKNRRGTNS